MIKKNISKISMTVIVLIIFSLFTNFNVNAETFYGTNPENGQVLDNKIISQTEVSVNSAQKWAESKGATQTFIGLASLYFKYSGQCGQVNPAIAYAQSAKETNFGKFSGVVDETFNNPCGLKIKEGGNNFDKEAHKRFSSWDEGVKAHLDHLALYAGADGYPKSDTSDPRHFDIIKGKAMTVKSLGGNWAPSKTYGDEVNNYYNELVNFSKSLVKTIVIDPGHNYSGDQGAESLIDGVTYSEVELNMELSSNLKAELESRGFKVILTRQPNIRMDMPLEASLKNRVVIANKYKADLFISIHHNSAESKDANGIEIYYSSSEQGDDFRGEIVQSNKLDKSKQIANAVIDKVSNGMNIYNRGIKDSTFFIKSTNMPSILIESGFITNKDEAMRCSSEKYQKIMSKLIADAVEENL